MWLCARMSQKPRYVCVCAVMWQRRSRSRSDESARRIVVTARSRPTQVCRSYDSINEQYRHIRFTDAACNAFRGFRYRSTRTVRLSNPHTDVRDVLKFHLVVLSAGILTSTRNVEQIWPSLRLTLGRPRRGPLRGRASRRRRSWRRFAAWRVTASTLACRCLAAGD